MLFAKFLPPLKSVAVSKSHSYFTISPPLIKSASELFFVTTFNLSLEKLKAALGRASFPPISIVSVAVSTLPSLSVTVSLIVF